MPLIIDKWGRKLCGGSLFSCWRRHRFVVMAVATPVASADYGISVGSGSSG
jgi:hypothetical protein